MLYKGYWIEFVDLSSRSVDGQFDAVFFIRRRHSREILAEATSISQALRVIQAFDLIAAPTEHIRARKGAA